MKTLIVFLIFIFPFSLFSQLNETWLQQSSFVFVGEVNEINNTTVKGVRNQGIPVIIEVSKVELKPDAVSIPKSNLVTVILNKNSEVQRGNTYRFYGLGYIFGNELALTEVGHETPKDFQNDIRQTKKDLMIKEHLKKANLIAVGKVLEIRTPKNGRMEYDSEHNPEWKEAIVVLENILRGPQAEKIIIRFPSSIDVAWYKVPKLKENQEVLFIAKTDKMISGLKEGVIEGKTINTYVLTDEMDVMERDEISRIEGLLKQ